MARPRIMDRVLKETRTYVFDSEAAARGFVEGDMRRVFRTELPPYRIDCDPAPGPDGGQRWTVIVFPKV